MPIKRLQTNSRLPTISQKVEYLADLSPTWWWLKFSSVWAAPLLTKAFENEATRNIIESNVTNKMNELMNQKTLAADWNGEWTEENQQELLQIVNNEWGKLTPQQRNSYNYKKEYLQGEGNKLDRELKLQAYKMDLKNGTDSFKKDTIIYRDENWVPRQKTQSELRLQAYKRLTTDEWGNRTNEALIPTDWTLFAIISDYNKGKQSWYVYQIKGPYIYRMWIWDNDNSNIFRKNKIEQYPNTKINRDILQNAKDVQEANRFNGAYWEKWLSEIAIPLPSQNLSRDISKRIYQ